MHVLVAVNVLLWGCLALLGNSLIAGVADQHVLGYPNNGQVSYYIWTPVAVMATALATYILSLLRRATWLFLTIEVLSLLFFFPYILPYTGGI